MRVNKILSEVVDFIQEKYCEIDNPDQSCENCSDYLYCPVRLAIHYLEEEGYE